MASASAFKAIETGHRWHCLRDMDETYELLTESLREERSADSSLTDLAEHSINRLAMPAAK